MLRPTLGYGITPDLELSLSAPIPLRTPSGQRPSRMMGMSTAASDVEGLLSWRFHRQTVGVGARFESTALLGVDYPVQPERDGQRTAPGLVLGAVTGFASRSIYAWAGALYRRYQTAPGAPDHPGDLLLYSAAVGYRPEVFRRALPHADWRLFVEAVGEWTAPDRLAGAAVSGTGGNEIFVGPTVLGLFGAWGISGGPMIAAYRSGAQQGDRLRFAANYSYWF